MGCRCGRDWGPDQTHRRAARALTPAGARRGGAPTARIGDAPAGRPRLLQGGPPPRESGRRQRHARAWRRRGCARRHGRMNLLCDLPGMGWRVGREQPTVAQVAPRCPMAPDGRGSMRNVKKGLSSSMEASGNVALGLARFDASSSLPRDTGKPVPPPPPRLAEVSSPSLAPRPTRCARRVSPRVARCRGAAALVLPPGAVEAALTHGWSQTTVVVASGGKLGAREGGGETQPSARGGSPSPLAAVGTLAMAPRGGRGEGSCRRVFRSW